MPSTPIPIKCIIFNFVHVLNRDASIFPNPLIRTSASKLVDRGWGVPLQTIPIQNTNSTIAYYVEGSKLDQIVPNLATHGLTLSLETTSDSKMTLFVPRSFVDSTSIGEYASFNITADGNKINYHEHLTPTDRMFTILLQNGTKNLQIIPLPFTENQASQKGNTTLPASFEPCDTPYPQSNTGV